MKRSAQESPPSRKKVKIEVIPVEMTEHEIISLKFFDVLGESATNIDLKRIALVSLEKYINASNIERLYDYFGIGVDVEILDIVIRYKKRENDKSSTDKLNQWCIQFSQRYEQDVRRRALYLLTWMDLTSNLQLVLRSANDIDSRVRGAIIEAISGLTEHNDKLYSLIVQYLSDDDNTVRLEALELFHRYLVRFGSITNPMGVKLADEGFGRICMMIRDVNMVIREKACLYVGQLPDVSESLLISTFKKVDLQKTYDQVTGESDATGEYSVSLNSYYIHSGTVGSIVLGLEDEFYQVRKATLLSLTEMCNRSQELFNLSIHYMIDTFSDEIDVVRKCAIDSVSGIGRTFLISRDQLDIILSLLKDYSMHIRGSIHQLLTCVIVPNMQCLSELIRDLMVNMNKYLQDTDKIFKAMKFLGQKHPFMAEYLVEELLGINGKFLTQEPRLDVTYIGRLIFLTNAAELNNNIKTIYPDFVKLHLESLAQKYHHHLPETSQLSDSGVVHSDYEKCNNLYQFGAKKSVAMLIEKLMKSQNPNSLRLKYLECVLEFVRGNQNVTKLNEIVLLYPKLSKSTLSQLYILKYFAGAIAKDEVMEMSQLNSTELDKFFPLLCEVDSEKINCVLKLPESHYTFQSFVPWRVTLDLEIDHIKSDTYLRVCYPDHRFSYFPLVIEHKEIHDKIEISFEKWNSESKIELQLVYKTDSVEVGLSNPQVLTIFPN